MKKLGVLIIITLFLLGFTVAKGFTSLAVDNDNKDQGNNAEQNQENNTGIDATIKDRIRNRLTPDQIEAILQVRNRIRAMIESGECPGNCTCDGSTVKCQLKNGTREMAVVAGKSGNVIVQVKGINASTRVELYKGDDGRLYGVFGNETREVRMLPDQVREKIRERLARNLEDEEIDLSENGTYNYRAQERARLLGIFPVRVAVRAELDPETGELIQIRKSWWAFMAASSEEPIVGASCGTVTPGMNDQCCINRGYDSWDSETGECIFAED